MATVRPSLAEIRGVLARDSSFRSIPLSREIFSDTRTPIETLKILKNVSDHCFILESVEDAKKWGRYTFLGFEPTLTISGKTGDPTKEIRETIADYKAPRFDYLPPFTGGLVGYFSYDFLKYTEPKLKLTSPDDEGFNAVDLMLFDKVIAYDNFRQKIVVIVNIKTDDLEANYEKGTAELDRLIGLLTAGTPAEDMPGKVMSDFRYLFDEPAFCKMVEKAKRHIVEGDIFQAVLSNRADADFEGSLFNTYRVLRTKNPSPYMFYFGSPEQEIAGASPETLVKLTDDKLFTFPLAGTRPRGTTDEKDAALERELLSDEKELAEHNMLVDLGRNDLGRISEFGSVKVEKYLSVERFSHVMHIGSTVSGDIREGFDAMDAVSAVLPAGTLSGAPKLRAMEIIDSLEQNKRGIYGGAIGYLDFTGNLDCCIAIRIAYKRGGKVYVRSGAGIVADSIPANEYRECVNKSKAVIESLLESVEIE
ncbi:anthranilate synthase component I [Clostridia bacterium]|nr:anthranilate synthase component I [Clostridia bacterium]